MKYPLVAVSASLTALFFFGCAAKERSLGVEGSPGGAAGSSSGGAAGSLSSGGTAGSTGGAGAGGSSAGGSSAGGMGGNSSGGSTAGSSAGGSGGQAGECVPSTSEECYSGPTNTQDAGECRGGTRVCSATGTWGVCDGEVLPAVENCADPNADENCDGYECGIWGRSLSGFSVFAAAGLPEGRTAFAGTFSQFSLEGTPHTSQGGDDVAVVSVGRGGTVGWVFKAGSAGGDGLSAVAGGLNGQTLLSAYFGGPVSLGGATRSGSVILSVDYEGKVSWSKMLPPQLAIKSLSVDPQGNTLFTGTFTGTINVDGEMLVSPGTAPGLCVGRLRPNGELDWAKAWTSPNGVEGHYVASSSTEIYVAGAVGPNVDFGGGVTNHAGGQDVFVLQLSGAGGYLGAEVMGTPARDLPTGLSASPSGNVNLTYFENNQPSTTQIRGFHFNEGAFVLDYMQWGTGLNTQINQSACVSDDAGGVAIVGRTPTTGASMGNLTLPGGVSLLLRMDLDSSVAWYRELGTAGQVSALARSFSGELAVAGTTPSASFDLGSGPVTGGAGVHYMVQTGR